MRASTRLPKRCCFWQWGPHGYSRTRKFPYLAPTTPGQVLLERVRLIMWNALMPLKNRSVHVAPLRHACYVRTGSFIRCNYVLYYNIEARGPCKHQVAMEGLNATYQGLAFDSADSAIEDRYVRGRFDFVQCVEVLIVKRQIYFTASDCHCGAQTWTIFGRQDSSSQRVSLLPPAAFCSF